MKAGLHDQEPDDLPLRKILVAAGVTLLVFSIGVACMAEGLTGRHFTTVPAPHSTVQYTLINVGAPGLERASAVRLDRFGWADRDAGVATIPIDRAIDVTLKERK